jgi:hypothetical protein
MDPAKVPKVFWFFFSKKNSLADKACPARSCRQTSLTNLASQEGPG